MVKMTNKEAIKILENKGFIKLNQVGSHIKYGRGTERVTLVFHSSPKERINLKIVKQINGFKDI